MTSPSKPGSRLGRYEIVSPLGSGGMGEVFLANDTMLDRKVALKILPEDLASNPSNMQRFIQEAKAASALNHPNIITIYEIGVEPNAHFIATEFIDGPTLRRKLAVETLSIAQAIDIALQVASALSTAHAAGIIHRDIKPENVMLRRDGIVKVLDFGLAKLTARYGVTEPGLDAATKPIFQTQPGVIVGTTAYMSPEQTRGIEIDTRTDVWSLGVVLYEMLAGQTPFREETASDTSAAILRAEPAPLSEYLPDIPFELERIVRKALQKDRDERYQGVKDFELDLKSLKRELDLGSTYERSASGIRGLRSSEMARSTGASKIANTQMASFTRDRLAQTPWFWIIVGAIAAGSIAAGLYFWQRKTQSPDLGPANVTSFQLFSRKNDLGEAGPTHGRFSPDGKFIVFSSTKDGASTIWLKQINGGEPFANRTVPGNAPTPVWSPDGQQIAFLSRIESQTGISTMAAFAGSPTVVKVLDRASSGLVCWRDNQIYFVVQGNLESLNMATNEVSELTRFDPSKPTDRFYSISPDSEHIAYSDIQAGQSDIWVTDRTGQTTLRLTNDEFIDTQPVWTPDGKSVVYSTSRNGVRQIFVAYLDGRNPTPLTVNDSNIDVLDVSPDGTRILYATGREDSDLWRVDLDGGKETQLTVDTGIELWPAVSPDGQKFAFQSLPAASGTTVFTSFPFIKSLNTDSSEIRIATDGFIPTWSPDGSRIAFLRQTNGQTNIWIVNANGEGAKALTTTGVVFGGYSYLPYNRLQTQDFQWSNDGTKLTFCAKVGGVTNVWQISVDGSAATQLSDNTEPDRLFFNPVWSPDGRTVAWLGITPGHGDKKTTWSVLLASEGKTREVFRTELFAGLIGWSKSNDSLIIKSIPNAALNFPTEVSLFAVSPRNNGQLPIASLKATYFLNIRLSPARNQIAYVTRQDGTDSLRLISINGSSTKAVIASNDSRMYFSGLEWSPDGNSIFYGKQGRWSTLTMLDNFKSR
jgi:serine/threonine protein kinase